MLFRVSWEIDVDAPSILEAATTAYSLMTGEDSTATVFTVQRPEGTLHEVDLQFAEQRAIVTNLNTQRRRVHDL